MLIFETTASVANGSGEVPALRRYLWCTTKSKLPRCRTRKSTGGGVSKDINILALAKGEERYIFLYNEETRNETLRTLGRYASNSELSFSWYDAAVMSQKVRKNAKLAESETAEFSSNLHRLEALPLEDLLADEEPLA